MGAPCQYSNIEIVFFDIETGGFYRTDDILQISAKCGDAVFNRYADPTKYISPEATFVHGLTSNNVSDLYLRGKRVESSPLKTILIELLHFLRGLGESCILVAHNCGFDSSRLLLKIQHFSLIDEFRQVVVGFTDSLNLFKQRFRDRAGPGAFKLASLAKELLNLSHEEVHASAHDAMYDVELLEKLVVKFISHADLVKCAKSFDHHVGLMHRKEKSLPYLRTLRPLAKVVSKAMLERMAYAGIAYDSILSEYQKGDQYVIDLLEQRVDGRPQVIKKRRILNNILDYLSEL